MATAPKASLLLATDLFPRSRTGALLQRPLLVKCPVETGAPPKVCGAPEGTRTPNLSLTKGVLYQLSYWSIYHSSKSAAK